MNLQIIFIISFIVIVLACVSYYFIFVKNNADKKSTKENFLANENTLPIIKENVPHQDPVENDKKEILKTSNKSTEKNINIDIDNVSTKTAISISSKTEKALLKKLENFENTKAFLQKDVNLNNLAKKFDTNTKYLSEIIKSYKNKNFNQYINELRINHLINELNSNEKVLKTKISYLASDFGFNSHSSFTTLFTQIVGQSPSEYIKNLKAQKEEKK